MSETFTTDFEEETIDPTIDWPESMEPGIYFGLPEADYHADKALSNSGIKNMMISPLDYWARSWMNPAYEEEEKPHFKIGKAWRKRLLEGSDAFYEEYAVALDKADYPEALVTSDDIKAKLKELGEKMTGKKADQIERLVAIDPSIEIWDVLVENHAEVNDGKILLEPDIVATVEAQASMIEGHPDISRCFTGGYPEVSVFWRDAKGLPMKARFDYLKPGALVDLKSFSNPLGKPLDRAISGAMASGKYHVQAATYWRALEFAIAFIREGKVFGEADPKWLDLVAQVEDHDRQFVFVFQQTGIAPNTRARVFPRGLVFESGQSSMSSGMSEYDRHWQQFQTDPWIDLTPINSFDDAEFPFYMTEA